MYRESRGLWRVENSYEAAPLLPHQEQTFPEGLCSQGCSKNGQGMACNC